MKQVILIKSNKLMKGNLGLHDELPKGKEFPNVPPKGEIWVNSKLSEKRRKEIIKHEKFENYMMKRKKLSYKKAHEIAQEWEKY